MKYSKAVLLAIMLGLTSGTALAEGVYVAGDIGQGNAPDACNGLPSGFSCNTTTTAYRVGLGYQVNNNVGFEAAYLDGGKINANGTVSGIPVTASVTLSGFQFGVIGALPVSNSVSLLGKAGVAMLDGKSTATASSGGTSSTSSDSASNTNFAFGAGVRFAASEKVSIRLMYEDFGTIKASKNDTGSKVSLLSAGIQIGF